MSPTTRSVIAACVLTVACISGQGQVVAPPAPIQGSGLQIETYCKAFEAQSVVLRQTAPAGTKKPAPSAQEMAEGKDAVRAVVKEAAASKASASASASAEDGPDPDVMRAMCSMVTKLRADNSPAHRVIRVPRR